MNKRYSEKEKLQIIDNSINYYEGLQDTAHKILNNLVMPLALFMLGIVVSIISGIVYTIPRVIQNPSIIMQVIASVQIVFTIVLAFVSVKLIFWLLSLISSFKSDLENRRRLYLIKHKILTHTVTDKECEAMVKGFEEALSKSYTSDTNSGRIKT